MKFDFYNFIRISSLYLIFSFIVSSCSHTEITTTKMTDEKIGDDFLTYADYWSAITLACPDTALVLAKNNDEISLANSMKALVDNRRNDAIDTLINLRKRTKNDTILSVTSDLLSDLFIYEQRYEDQYRIFKRDTVDAEIEKRRLLYPLIIDKPRQSVEFSSEIDTIDMKLHKGLPHVKVNINGKEYDFVFDTGAQTSLISDEIAEECGIKLIASIDSALTGSTDDKSTLNLSIANSIRLGNASFKNSPIMIVDHNLMKFKFLFITWFSFDGLIGWNLIKKMDITMDYKNEKMYIRKPVKQTNPPNNMFWLSDPVVKAKTPSGLDLNIFFDSGAMDSHVYNLFLKKYKDLETDETTNKYSGIGGTRKIDATKISSVDLFMSGHKINCKNIKTGMEYGDGFLHLDAALGSDFIKNGQIHIDATNGIFELCTE